MNAQMFSASTPAPGTTGASWPWHFSAGLFANNSAIVVSVGSDKTGLTITVKSLVKTTSLTVEAKTTV